MTPEQEAVAEKMAYEAEELAREIGKLLAGRGSMIQGAALADLVSMWLAGHQPAEYRALLLKDWLKTVLELVQPNEAAILERFKGKPN